MVLEALGDLRVAELEQASALLDDRDLDAEGGEHGCVLDPDHASSDHDGRGRDAVEVPQAVRVEDRPVVELDRRRARGSCPGCDHDSLGGQPAFGAAGNRNGVRIDEARAAGLDVHVVPNQLVLHDVDLALHHLPRAQAEILDGDLLLHAIAGAVGLALRHPREVDDRLAERLRGDRPPVDRDPAELAALDEGHAVAQLRGLDRGLLTGRPGPDDEELVVVRHRAHHVSERTRPTWARVVTERRPTGRAPARPRAPTRGWESGPATR